MTRHLLAAICLALVACGSETQSSSGDASLDGADATGANACEQAGGQCARDAQSFSCSAFGADWVQLPPGDKLSTSCGGTPVPDGSAIPSRPYPCCLRSTTDAGGDAIDAIDATDSDASWKLKGCGGICTGTTICQYPQPPGFCVHEGGCTPGCPGCTPLPPPSCQPLPPECSAAPTCDCLIKHLCFSFGGQCEQQGAEFVVACMGG